MAVSMAARQAQACWMFRRDLPKAVRSIFGGVVEQSDHWAAEGQLPADGWRLERQQGKLRAIECP